MSTMLFAIVGGLLALALRGYNFNVSSGVGMISLFGVSIMSGVLYVSRVNRLREDFGTDLTTAARTAAAVQFRPPRKADPISSSTPLAARPSSISSTAASRTTSASITRTSGSKRTIRPRRRCR